MGDKSPKSKHRSEKQKQAVKAEVAAKAKTKHAGLSFGGAAVAPKSAK